MSDIPSIRSLVIAAIAVFVVLGGLLCGVCLFWVALHVFGEDNIVWSWKLILGLLSGIPALIVLIIGVACSFEDSKQELDKLD